MHNFHKLQSSSKNKAIEDFFARSYLHQNFSICENVPVVPRREILCLPKF